MNPFAKGVSSPKQDDVIPCPHVALNMEYNRDTRRWEFRCTKCLKVFDDLVLAMKGRP